MKVAFMLGSLNRGGTEMLLLDVCRNLPGTGIEGFVYHRKDGLMEGSFKETGVPILSISPKSVPGIFSYFIKLRKSLKLSNIEIIHAQQNIDALYAKLASLGTGRKVVQTFHGYDFNYGTLQRLLMRISVLLCNATYFVSNTQREYYLAKYKVFRKRKTAVIYNGIDFIRISNAAESTILEEYHVIEKTLKLAMVGNFVPVRDHMTICRFLNLLNQKEIDFMFFFIGAKDQSHPELFDNCVKYCSDHKLNEKVIFTGSRSDVPGILQKLDIFVYSSRFDTFGIAVIEAMAAGIPVIANNWEVIQEITLKGKYARLYSSGDINDLHKCFNDLEINKNDIPFLINEARQYLKENFSIQKHIGRLETEYRVLLKNNKSPLC